MLDIYFESETLIKKIMLSRHLAQYLDYCSTEIVASAVSFYHSDT
jgi:hypothetical protein